jgi:hypothetical protein
MYGRVTWYKGSAGEDPDEGIKAFEELLPNIRQLPGYVGCALMIDRPAAEALSIVYYQDHKSLEESRALVARMRQGMPGGGPAVSRIEEYEITTMERAQPGTTGKWARVISATAGDTSRLNEGIKAVNERSVPVLKQQSGFRSFVGGVNRDNGAAVTGATFDTAEQLEASNAALAPIRADIQKLGELKDLKIQVFEIVVADVSATSALHV